MFDHTTQPDSIEIFEQLLASLVSQKDVDALVDLFKKQPDQLGCLSQLLDFNKNEDFKMFIAMLEATSPEEIPFPTPNSVRLLSDVPKIKLLSLVEVLSRRNEKIFHKLREVQSENELLRQQFMALKQHTSNGVIGKHSTSKRPDRLANKQTFFSNGSYTDAASQETSEVSNPSAPSAEEYYGFSNHS